MKKYCYLAMTLAALAGCGDKGSTSKPENLLTSNDFEELEGWTGDLVLPSLTKEKAHSGTYSVRVGPDIEYSNGFAGTLGKISSIKLSKIQVKGWVYIPGNKTAATVVISLADPNTPNGQPALWEALPLDKITKHNEWVEVEKTITLPVNVSSNFKLYTYLWNGGAPNVAYLDDLQILRAQ